jgi:disulfide bond formation protein DsbB
MYPQVFLFAYAWYKKDRNVLPYSLVLSGVGFVIAGYHHMLQIGYDMYKPCSTSPFAVDCAKPTFVEFGFVTFPFMALVLFGALILLVITATHFAKRIVKV